MILQRRCRICGSENVRDSFIVKEMMFGTREEFEYFQCCDCRCLQIADIPTDMSRHYPSGYYSLSTDSARPSAMMRTFRKIRADQAIRKTKVGSYLLRRFPNHALSALAELSPAKSSRILDVGSGTGAFVKQLGEIGYHNARGVDPYIVGDVRFSSGVEVRKMKFEQVEGIWDIIMFAHSFEHMARPLEALTRISELLSPNGTCILNIPTVSSYAWEFYGTDWVQLDAPRHLHVHSIESLRYLSMNSGLQLDRVVYNSTDFQFWGSEQYRRDMPLFSDTSFAIHPDRSGFRRKDISEFRRTAERLNAEGRGDQFAAYLTKPLADNP